MANAKQPGEAANPATATSAGDQGVALVIDDSEVSLRRTAAMLTAKGYTVIEASNGLEGIRRVYRDTPDVVISDVVMPELNGYQLCRLIKNDAAVSHIPVILLTSLGEARDRFWGTQAGADRYVLKKDALEELADVVVEVVCAARATNHYSGTLFYVSNAEMDDSSIKSRVSFLLDKLLFEQTLVNEARRLSSVIHRRDRFVTEFLALLGRLVAYDRAALLLRDRQGAHVYIDAPKGIAPAQQRDMLERAVRDSGDITLFERHRITFLNEHPSEQDALHEQASATASCGIVNDGELLGTLVLQRAASEPYSQDTTAVLHLLSRNVAMTVKLMSLYEENRWLSITDPLTHLFNRRHFLSHFEQQFEQFSRYGVAASLVFIDIDNFKLINDTFGHGAADMVLVQLAALVGRRVRKVDIVARLGGEEFAVMLPQTPVDNATILAERLRAAVEEEPFGTETQPISVTVSIGVAQFAPGMRRAEALLDLADRAMYEAKRRGKNCVVTEHADPPG